MKKIGYIDARRIKLPGKIDVHSWGAVLHGGYYLYMHDDYQASIASLASGQLDFSLATRANFRIAGAIRFYVAEDGFYSAYRGTLTGFVDIGGGSLKTPMKSDPDPASREEGEIWYNTVSDKLEFKTAVGAEQITSV